MAGSVARRLELVLAEHLVCHNSDQSSQDCICTVDLCKHHSCINRQQRSMFSMLTESKDTGELLYTAISGFSTATKLSCSRQCATERASGVACSQLAVSVVCAYRGTTRRCTKFKPRQLVHSGIVVFPNTKITVCWGCGVGKTNTGECTGVGNLSCDDGAAGLVDKCVRWWVIAPPIVYAAATRDSKIPTQFIPGISSAHCCTELQV